MTKPTFDMEAAIQALRDGKDLTGKDRKNIVTFSLSAARAEPFSLCS